MTTRLRELLGKATKGPWKTWGQRKSGWEIIGGEAIIANILPSGIYSALDEANAALIVEAVNKLPALLDALDEARGALESGIYALAHIEMNGKGNGITLAAEGLQREALAKINEVMK